MKNTFRIIFLIFISFFVIIFNEAFAATSEEEECFVQLSKSIKNDTRFRDSKIFPNENLTKVLFDERYNSYINLNNYNEFLSNAVVNPLYYGD
jgi:hypothetical protein